MTLILLIILLVTTPKEEELKVSFHIYPTGYWDERAEDMINNFPEPK